MKTLDIAFKDILRSFRSIFFLAFGLAIPMLVSGLFYLAFGGLASADEGKFALPAVQVQVVNLDQGSAQAGGFSAGQLLADLLQSEQLASILQVTTAPDAAAARAAVDRQEAGVALIVPEDLTSAVLGPGGQATVELYQDPTLTIGPQIVKAIVGQFVEAFAGTGIAGRVVSAQFARHGATWDAAVQGQVSNGYVAWAQGLGAGESQLAVRAPAGLENKGSGIGAIIGLVTAGMLAFYSFFTGAASAMGFLQEEEDGTLPRLFTTPTPLSAILGGKFLAIFAVLIVQVVTLLGLSALIFKVNWGAPLPLTLAAVGLIVLAACFGIFVTSLLKNTRQTGIVYGGVLTVLGMIGMGSVFTGGVAGPMDTVSLFVPQGWGVRGLRLLLQGAGTAQVLPTMAVQLGLAVVFFAIGLWRFRQRFSKEV